MDADGADIAREREKNLSEMGRFWGSPKWKPPCENRESNRYQACCIFGTFITCHKFFNVPPSTTADVVCDSARPWATGMKETTVARTHRVCVSAPHKRPLCSSSELKN